MSLLEILRNRNRTLLELHVGIIFFGLICQMIGAFIVKNQGSYALSLWFGIVTSMVSAYHMNRTLERALDSGANAGGIALKGYLFRYIMLFIILMIAVKLEPMNPLVVFLGYMSLKISALIEPITHKLGNKVFHEDDSIPHLLAEKESNSMQN